MKKILAIILALVFVLLLTACGEDDKADVNTSTGGDLSEISTSSEDSDENKADDISSNTPSEKSENSSKASSKNSSVQTTPSSKPTTSTTKPAVNTSKPTTSTKLNPKKDFKYGKYEAKYFDNNKKTYTVCSLSFNKEYESLEYNYCTYYNKEGAKEFDSGFDESMYSSEEKITVSGVTYYDVGNWGGLPLMYEITDTAIKISEDGEKWASFSLNTNGSLTLDSSDRSGQYAKIGTIFTYTGQ